MREESNNSERRSVVMYGLILFLLLYFAFPVIPQYLAIYCFGLSNTTAVQVLAVAFRPIQFLIGHSRLYEELYIYEAKKCGLVSVMPTPRTPSRE